MVAHKPGFSKKPGLSSHQFTLDGTLGTVCRVTSVDAKMQSKTQRNLRTDLFAFCSAGLCYSAPLRQKPSQAVARKRRYGVASVTTMRWGAVMAVWSGA